MSDHHRKSKHHHHHHKHHTHDHRPRVSLSKGHVYYDGRTYEWKDEYDEYTKELSYRSWECWDRRGHIHQISKERRKWLDALVAKEPERRSQEALKEQREKDAQERKQRERELDELREKVLADEEAARPSRPAETAPEPADDGSGIIKRDKHGIRLYSQGDKGQTRYFLNVCVNRSTKIPGCFTVRLFAKGVPITYTFGKQEMEALEREVQRWHSASQA